MKSLYTLFAAVISFLAISSVSAQSQVACTMDYTPVCGAVQVQCIRAPCYPVYQTFGNMCSLGGASNATFIKKGECGADEGSQVVLSEGLKTALRAQYDAFIGRISGFELKTQIVYLQALSARIDARVKQVEVTSAIEVIRRDKLLTALALLASFTKNDITAIQNTLAGTQYVSRNPEQCNLMDYICKTGTTAFTDATGCGCKL